MIRTQEIYSRDIKRALGAREHEVRQYVALQPLASRDRAWRAATPYTALDLLFLAVIQQLHRAGFAPKALGSISAALYKALAQPVSAEAADILMLHQDNRGALKLGPAPENSLAMEIKLPLEPARLLVLQYTGAHLVSGQGELGLLSPVKSSTLRAVGGRRASR